MNTRRFGGLAQPLRLPGGSVLFPCIVGGFALTALVAAAPLAAQDLEPVASAGAPATPAPEPATGSGTSLRLVIQPESRLWFEGGSTVRGYKCQATTLDGTSTVEVPGGELALAALGDAVAKVALDIPVAGLDCDNGTMNDHMRKALQAEKHPVITYRHDGHEVAPSADGTAQIRMRGRLTIAGQERDVAMDAVAVTDPDGTLRILGNYVLDMTEYGVKPPRLVLGTLKVHDDVTVRYDLVLRP